MQPPTKRKRRSDDVHHGPSAALRRTSTPTPRLPFSSATDLLANILNGKLHRFPEFVEAATVYHSIHRTESAVTNLPKSFVVPSHPPYPAHLHGLKLNTAQIRTHFKSGNLHPESVAALRAINFVFDVNELKWRLKIQAFETYKAINGDLKIQQDFVVPRHDDRWPPDTWGMRLGLAVRSLRQKTDMCPARVAQLSSMGFVWNVLEQGWEIKVLALSTYKAIYGDLLVPYSFKTPSENDGAPGSPHGALHRWPQETWNMKLGHAVHNLRQNVDDMPASRRDTLNSMGFVWDCLEMSWDLKLAALQRYKDLYGDVTVPYGFRVPRHDVQWPQDTWDLKLGQAIHSMRQQGPDMPSERRESLNRLGFVWDGVDQVTWETKLRALHEYKEIHGHLSVPSQFKVPTSSHVWPKEACDLKLGAVVAALRHQRDELSSEYRQALDAMGFQWQHVQRDREVQQTVQPAREPTRTHQSPLNSRQSTRLYPPPNQAFAPREERAEYHVSPNTWDTVLDALHTYGRLYGNVHTMPVNFVVPRELDYWPQHTWHLELGRWLQALQREDMQPPLTVHQELARLGVVHAREDASKRQIEAVGAAFHEDYPSRAPRLPRLPELNRWRDFN